MGDTAGDTVGTTVGTTVLRGEVVTMDRHGTIIADGAVLIEGPTIAAVGRFDEIHHIHRQATVVGDGTGLVTPGYINAHQHLTGDRLLASCIPDDIDSNSAIFDWAVPVHTAHSGDDDELSATLAAVAAVTNGVTCTAEAGTVAHPDRVARGVQQVGLRTLLGRWGWDAAGVPFAAPADEVVAAMAELLDRYPPGGLVSGWVTLVGHDLASDELFAGASDLARARGAMLTLHMSPHDRDPQAFIERAGVRPLVHLQRLGVLGRHLLVGHAVHLDDDEVAAVLDSDTAVAACPWAYLRLAQGVTRAGRYADLLRGGARLAVGCDSENAGDAVDVLRAAALLVGLIRDSAGDPTIATAETGLRLATVGGARALGLADRLGSIEAGKQADVVLHDRRGAQFAPAATDPVRQLVWGSDGRSVAEVFIAGRHVVSGGRCLTVDLDGLRDEAAARQRHLLARRSG